MADLWSLLEDELQTQATAILGDTGDDLAIITVLIDTVYDLDYLSNRLELPALLIISVDADEAAGPHGDSLTHLDMSYPFHLVAVSKKTTEKRTAQRNAKELRRRLLAFVRNNDVQAALEALTGDDGERVQWVNYNNSGATVFGPANQDNGPYLSVAGVRFTIQTEV